MFKNALESYVPLTFAAHSLQPDPRRNAKVAILLACAAKESNAVLGNEVIVDVPSVGYHFHKDGKGTQEMIAGTEDRIQALLQKRDDES